MRTIVGVLAALYIGCSNAPSTIPPFPTQPTGAVPPTEQYAVHGLIHDRIQRPVPDVRVEVLDGLRAGASAMTDADGRFELPGTFSGWLNVRASREGYVPAVRPIPTVGERRFLYVTLDLSAESVNLASTYTMTVTAGAGCELATDLRTRTYTASMRSLGPNVYEATLSGGRFLAFPPGRISITIAGTVARVYLGDPYDWFDAIVEEVGSSAYLMIWGFGNASVDAFPTGFALEYGGVEYCESPTPPIQSGSGGYRCPSTPVRCDLQQVQLVRQ